MEIIQPARKWSASICLDGEDVKVRVPQSLADHCIIDYTVVHELCRVLEYSHSRRYWRDMDRVLPDYRDLRRPLKERGVRRLGI